MVDRPAGPAGFVGHVRLSAAAAPAGPPAVAGRLGPPAAAGPVQNKLSCS